VFLGHAEALLGNQQDAVSRPQVRLRFLPDWVRLGLSDRQSLPGPQPVPAAPFVAPLAFLAFWVLRPPSRIAAYGAACRSCHTGWGNATTPIRCGVMPS
jgi:hypothetical protein